MPPAQQRPPLVWVNICCWALCPFFPCPKRMGRVSTEMTRSRRCGSWAPFPTHFGHRARTSWMAPGSTP
eukprot:9470943-Pyramimonas_sp.AAC.1